MNASLLRETLIALGVATVVIVVAVTLAVRVLRRKLVG
jgi:hypothetical protein